MTHFSFILPYHKADCLYAGNIVIIEALPHSPIAPLPHMHSYLSESDLYFLLLPTLWLTAQGQPPTYSWFISQLQNILGNDVVSHSLCSGGAMALALASVADNAIQAMGHWSSNTCTPANIGNDHDEPHLATHGGHVLGSSMRMDCSIDIGMEGCTHDAGEEEKAEAARLKRLEEMKRDEEVKRRLAERKTDEEKEQKQKQGEGKKQK
ncbi:hypothetical protein M422DRAFT_268017 [Sphaerobolus stellatus SS14]|uniref:Uncharacterized protein n=1 Tax=Sphaerobolus stellatus (strain SS14) TaxID=990650 RepID=A0A0C9UNN4_SPHS4|nr:hypothetical protein M422DRAFT_268017 [Sphaerobolus stellatus SS14]